VAVSFGYDSLGRLAARQLTGGAKAVSYAYPASGRTDIRDALGNTTTVLADAFGRTSQVHDPLGRTVALAYDDQSNLTRVTGPTGLSAEFTYDSEGAMVGVVDPMGHYTAFAYGGPLHGLTLVRDARGYPTEYAYDDFGNLARIAYADGNLETLVYDPQGNVVGWTNRRGNATAVPSAHGIRYEYNLRGQLTAKRFADGTVYTYAYDAASGRLTGAGGPEGETVLTYDANGRLGRIADPGGRWLAYTYDAAGRRASMTDQLGHRLEYHYDPAGRLSRLTDESGTEGVRYTYDAVGRLARKDLGNGVYSTYAYDAAGQLLELANHRADGAVISGFVYAYDTRGRRVSMAMLDGLWTYQYDDLGQLTRAMFDSLEPGTPDQDLAYAYDAMGNRVRTVENGLTTDYVTNAMNQYTECQVSGVGGPVTRFTYDADGNLIAESAPGGSTTYAYSDENRLVTVSRGADAWAYDYDALGERIATTGNGLTTQFVVDPIGLGNVVGEYDAGGALIARYDHGFGLLDRTDATGAAAWYTFDAIGNTRELVTADGTVANRYDYEPFGRTLGASETVPNAFRFVGELGVMREGNGLDCMRQRYAMAQLGVFTAEERMAVPGVTLTYAYADNSPTNLVDPNGTKSWLKGSSGMWSRETAEEWRRRYDTFQEQDENGDGWPDNRYRDWGGEPCHGTGEKCVYDMRHIEAAFNIALERGFLTSLAAMTYVEYKQGQGADRGSAWDWRDLLSNYLGAWAGGVMWDWHLLRLLASHTPEDKFGPTGYDPPGTAPPDLRRFVEAGATLPYRVEFWNRPDAPVPTQEALIHDTLDPAVFDLATFRFTRIGFLRWDVPITSGQVLSERVDCRPDLDLVVEVSGTLDLETGRSDWRFRCVDPLTGGYPEDPNAGFLPPFNPETGYELGWVEFTVEARPDLPSGTQIANQAFVQFDLVGPFRPAPPEGPWINTVDSEAPSSRVTALPAASPAAIPVVWSGTDAGAGVVTYDVFAQVDSGAFVPWLTGTALTQAVYTGTPGQTYGFYAIATDALGHREPAKTAAEAVTTVGYSVTFAAGDHGSLSGEGSQVVAPGGDASPVEAMPAAGYHLAQWLADGTPFSTANPLTVTAVTSDLTLTAEFAINTYALTYLAAPGGRVEGSTLQTVEHGDDGVGVTAVPAFGYAFDRWDDGSTANPRRDTAVTASLTVTATFRAASGADPTGAFLAVTDAGAVAAGRGWWDLSGAYAAVVAGKPLAMSLLQDTKGKLSGTATYTVAKDTALTMPIKGSVKGTGGSIAMKGTLKGATPDKTVSVALTMALTVDTANRRLTGMLTGSVKSGGATTAINQTLALDIPQPMDGTWTLAFQLAQGAKGIAGTARLTLSNGVDYDYVVRGKGGAGGTAVLTLAGDPADPAAKSIKIRTTITPLEGGWARIEAFSGKGFGQTLAW
jgi:RHS repeat-associated protein